jgi:hypothetical protein
MSSELHKSFQGPNFSANQGQSQSGGCGVGYFPQNAAKAEPAPTGGNAPQMWVEDKLFFEIVIAGNIPHHIQVAPRKFRQPGYFCPTSGGFFSFAQEFENLVFTEEVVGK